MNVARMMIGAAVLAVSTLAAADTKRAPVPLVLGISRTLDVPEGVGAVVLPDPRLLLYRRIVDAKSVPRQLILIPKKAGATTLTVLHPKSGEPMIHFDVTVVPQSLEAIEGQKQIDRSAGLAVADLVVPKGRTQDVTFPEDVGPIFLTDPRVVSYKRLNIRGSEKTLLLAGLEAGLTDLVAHDRQGKVMRRLYVEVK